MRFKPKFKYYFAVPHISFVAFRRSRLASTASRWPTLSSASSSQTEANFTKYTSKHFKTEFILFCSSGYPIFHCLSQVEAGLTRKPLPDPVFRFIFPNSEKIPPPVMAFQNVSFAYSGKKEDYLYTNLEFGIDCDSRIALVG